MKVLSVWSQKLADQGSLAVLQAECSGSSGVRSLEVQENWQ